MHPRKTQTKRVRTARLSAHLMVALAAASVAQAAALTWDANTGSTGAQDGSGTWSTGGSGWWDGSANVSWTAGDSATFGGGVDGAEGAYGVTVSGNIGIRNWSHVQQLRLLPFRSNG
jgi:hypothetical protein